MTPKTHAHLIHLQTICQSLPMPLGKKLALIHNKDPFILMVSCLLSLRAKDRITEPVMETLYEKVRTFAQLATCEQTYLESVLYPLGFFKRKAHILKTVAQYILAHHQGRVPHTKEELLAIPYIGPKTAHFMLAFAFETPALCVDTHVHRLANAFGWVNTRTPEQTLAALTQLIPQDWWSELNTLLVTWGQHICPPRLAAHKHAEHNRICICKRYNPAFTLIDGTSKQ